MERSTLSLCDPVNTSGAAVGILYNGHGCSKDLGEEFRAFAH